MHKSYYLKEFWRVQCPQTGSIIPVDLFAEAMTLRRIETLQQVYVVTRVLQKRCVTYYTTYYFITQLINLLLIVRIKAGATVSKAMC